MYVYPVAEEPTEETLMPCLDALNLRQSNLGGQLMNPDAVVASATSKGLLVCRDKRLSKLISTEL